MRRETPRLLDATDPRDTVMWLRLVEGRKYAGGARWRVTAQLLAKLTSSSALDVVVHFSYIPLWQSNAEM